MISASDQTDPMLRTMPKVALLTTLGMPFEMRKIPIHPISDISDIEPFDKVVLLFGRGMGRRASALARARSTDRKVPPVVILAPEIDQQDIVQAFSRGPVSYSLEGTCKPVLIDLLRWTAEGQYGLHPAVLHTLLQRVRWEPHRASVPLSNTVPLTAREQEIMMLLSAGNDVANIANQLGLSQKTVRNNLTKIFAKLHVRRQTEAVLTWHGLV